MKLILLLIIIMTFFPSCKESRAHREESARKQTIDAESNKLIETETDEVVDTILNLDEMLYELDLTLHGEAGKFTQSFEDTNQKLTELKHMLNQLEKDLYSQAEDLKILRVETIEPVVDEAMRKYEARKSADEVSDGEKKPDTTKADT